MIFAFDRCELDLARLVLRRDGTDVRVEPQVFDLLKVLIERRGEVVRKEELLDAVWGDRFVSESALTTRVKSARQAVGDDGTRQQVIRTVHGRGYEFVAPVRELEVPAREPVAPGVAVGVPVGSALGTVLEAGPPPLGHGPVGLPAALQPLVGREELLGQLTAALGEARLLTLAGPGGVGKTSVGFELARRVAGTYPDGVGVVELVTVVDEDATLEAFATALDVQSRQQLSIGDAVVDVLRSRQQLLVLDNCEHVVDPLADLVARVLRAAPGVSIIATSREPLAVAGEVVWTVDPLPFAPEGTMSSAELAAYPAVALFVQRAREVQPSFQLDATNAKAVAEICRRLDGIPLAIELAAARARAIDVTEIARRLDERFRLLQGVRRGADPRHRRLEDAISWSYDMLTPAQQRLFAALAVFAGPFDLDAAERVCDTDDGDDVLDSLTRLTERSMLAVRRPPGGGTRYELLETLREFGRHRLEGARSVRLFSAHARHFATVAARVGAALATPAEGHAVGRADAAFADLRAALRFAVQVGDLDSAGALIGPIREYAMRTMRYEVLTWADTAAQAAERVGHPDAPLLRAICAYGAWVRGEFATAAAQARAARAAEQAAGAPPSGLPERVLANVLATVGDVTGALVEMNAQVALAEAAGSPSRLAHASYMGSVAASSVGDFERAEELAAMAREAAGRTGSPTDLASAYVADGFAVRSDDRAALEAFAEADRLARRAGNRWMRAFARTEACGLLVLHGDLAAGCVGLAEMVDVWYRSGDWSQQWHTLARCLVALDRVGKPELALQVIGAIEARATMGVPPVMPTLRDSTRDARASLVHRFGAEHSAELLRSGAALPVAEVVARARRALLGPSDRAAGR